jgi:hypothetical protein
MTRCTPAPPETVADPIAAFEKPEDCHLPTRHESTFEFPVPPGDPARATGEAVADAGEDSGAGDDPALLPAPRGGLGEAAVRPEMNGAEHAAMRITTRDALKAFNISLIWNPA